MPEKSEKELLKDIFNALYDRFGPQEWWPGETRLEIMIGAILTQNTNWGNVEKAISNLKERVPLKVREILKIKDELPDIIRPAGYFRIKAERLINFLEWLEERGGEVKLDSFKTQDLRKELLSIKGIGPETADSVLLYALNRSVFVIDAYTRRIFERHQIIPKNVSYEDIRTFFERNLPQDAKLFNEYHALLVRLGKTFCKKKPNCLECPLFPILGPPENLTKRG